MKHALSLFHLPDVLTMHTGEAMAPGGGDVFGWAGAQREGEQHRHKDWGACGYELPASVKDDTETTKRQSIKWQKKRKYEIVL